MLLLDNLFFLKMHRLEIKKIQTFTEASALVYMLQDTTLLYNTCTMYNEILARQTYKIVT